MPSFTDHLLILSWLYPFLGCQNHLAFALLKRIVEEEKGKIDRRMFQFKNLPETGSSSSSSTSITIKASFYLQQERLHEKEVTAPL